jgi:hypothetical protein
MQPNIKTWCNQFPRLPIFPRLFNVSSQTSTESVQQLLHVVESVCEHVFSNHTTRIPTSYRKLLNFIQNIADKEPTINCSELFERYPCNLTRPHFDLALQYFNSIGYIILLKNTIIFSNPMFAPQIAAKFVSPEEVRVRLLKEAGVEILTKDELGWLLDIDTKANTKYDIFSTLQELMPLQDGN